MRAQSAAAAYGTESVEPSPATNALPAVHGELPAYSFEETKALVETAMMAAVAGLAFLLCTILKLDSTISYFLPLPIILSALRPGVPVLPAVPGLTGLRPGGPGVPQGQGVSGAGWRTMVATAFLITVLLGPLRALGYVLSHGILAATLGTLWRWKVNWWCSVGVGSLVRFGAQLANLGLYSISLNEDILAIMISNTHAMLDQMSVGLGFSGTPSTLVVGCSIFAMVLVNSICFVILLHVIYRVLLRTMDYQLGPIPAVVQKVFYRTDQSGDVRT